MYFAEAISALGWIVLASAAILLGLVVVVRTHLLASRKPQDVEIELDPGQREKILKRLTDMNHGQEIAMRKSA